MPNTQAIANLLRAVADVLEPPQTFVSGAIPFKGGVAIAPVDQGDPVFLKPLKEVTPPPAAKTKLKRKRGQPWPCCGSKGTRHKAGCDGSGAQEDGPKETKEFTCDECMWKFETSNLDDVKCINCGSAEVWPVVKD